MANNSKSDLHVAVFAFPVGSHATPLLKITRKLASFEPNVIFSFFNTSQSNSLIFSRSKTDDDDHHHHHHELPNIKGYDVWDGVPKGYVFKGKPQEDIELFMVTAPPTLRKAVAEAEAETGRKVSHMMGDAFLWFVVEMAEEKGVPWVATWSGGQHDLSIHFHTDLLRERIGIQDIAQQRKDEGVEFIPGMSTIRVQDLPEGVVMGNLESSFSRMLHRVGQVLPRATAVCVSSCEELHPAATNDLRSKLPKLLCLGPYNLMLPSLKSCPDTSNCLTWLDKQEVNSVAYVSFGSVVRPSPGEIEALAQGLEASGVKFLWSLKDIFQVHLPLGFIENNRERGMVVQWAPQTDVLAHNAVGVFITHFGYNSIMESIVAQVPMIGRPFHGEQKLNRRFVEAVWNIGLGVESGLFTKDGVVYSLDRILRLEEGKGMRSKIKGLRELVQNALDPKGSCNDNFKLLLDIITNS